ncbi:MULTISPECIES: helix-turn-helix domain-containing protein [Sphingomonadaceae]|jgi:transcriptional regulator with XRE-family HTH domain|uniref:Helix-turn-helix domain-containing protein n=1 Tax=Sphingobium yanoikuyae TaxID=13690 RepID=A0AA43BA78_SPHYA|nr:helix-turn-helix transcriptional regulator [Sphingobium yanoikuyae]MDH2129537.1 helix-turn-helix domain-containing protein [Sphingobium yanoikuyae]MDH2149034.1 helix-turn-helix domain-containing protein [Sphingobium yanoikuyae]MDH2167660.1 helix-turn-helix domain-containing protein [Sphingobium yanoikuyae]MEE4453443.1 helix-turn-helix transcriptional regulator [Novosphingobium resinovorum]
MELVRILARNVKHHRKLQGMTQEQLALSIEMKRSYVSGIECANRNPSVKALERLASALNINPSELFVPLDEYPDDQYPPIPRGRRV